MKSLLSLILFLGLLTMGFSQEEYLVTLKGEKVAGTIKFFQKEYFDEVVVKNENGKQSFRIFQIDKIIKDGLEYGMVIYRNKRVVGQVIKKGTLSHYMIRPEGDYKFSISYLIKETGDNTEVTNAMFKRTLSEFFEDDCSSLVTKIQNKEFTPNDLSKVVDFYNNQCGASSSITAESTVASSSAPAQEAPQKNATENSLTEFAQLILDIQKKLDNNEKIPSYLLNALKEYSEIEINQELQVLINKIEGNK